MVDAQIQNQPKILSQIQFKCRQIGFTMPSDELAGSLLRTLSASKPGANILELGTGIGLSLAWMADGMCMDSVLSSIDNDLKLVQIAKEFFTDDPRITIMREDGSRWIRNYKGEGFDLIFADAWPGKYSELAETLNLVKPGGFYIVDDMLEQPNWPEGHDKLAQQLIADLEARDDFMMTKMNWSTGIIVMTRKVNL